jgi:hypothetical protein
MAAIIAGLHFSPIARLTKTIALLSKRALRIYQELTALTAIEFKEFYAEYSNCIFILNQKKIFLLLK